MKIVLLIPLGTSPFAEINDCEIAARMLEILLPMK
jgi:hypothetical protein